jgi:uncharacterized damage-inducible protein DinB
VVRQSADAASDRDIIGLLHHILVANRFWSCAVRRAMFVPDEMGTSPSCDALLEAYKRTHEEESAWLPAASDEDCSAVLEHPLIPGGRCSVAQAFMQGCMHSHGHRAQLVRMLRRHDVVPPQTDFILWLTTRDEPTWSTWNPRETTQLNLTRDKKEDE